jgi:hypothetical protein
MNWWPDQNQPAHYIIGLGLVTGLAKTDPW